MSEAEYEKQIAACSRRLNLLRLARSGSAKIQRVSVKSYTVREHRVRAHTRVYYRMENA